MDENGQLSSKTDVSTVERTHEVVMGDSYTVLRLLSDDGANKLSRRRVMALTEEIERLAVEESLKPLVIAGNAKFFSAGADLNEIHELTGAEAFNFAKMGQRLMRAVDCFPALVIASIEGYCMGGGLDLALACDVRVASPNAVFGHRGAALGIMTGWGGTQRLPQLIGKACAMQMFLTSETVDAETVMRYGLVNKIVGETMVGIQGFLV